jgi:chromosome segregation ATPase
MSDIDTQIEQIEKEIEKKKTDLNRYQEQVKRLEVEIEKLGNKFKRLSYTGKLDVRTKSEIAEARVTKRNQIDSYKKMINEVKKQITKYEKELQNLNLTPAVSTDKIENPDEPFSRLYDTSRIVSDEATERELEELIEENERKRLEEVAKQQQQNLSEREKTYEDKTGKKYNPLVTDDDEYVSLLEPSVSSKTRRKTPTPPIEIDSTPTTEKNKTKKKRPTLEGIELNDLSRTRETPEQVPLENIKINDEYFQDFKKDLTPTSEQVSLGDVKIQEQTGFSETLIRPYVKAKETPKIDKNVCKNIFENSSKVNKAHFFPSEFPKLTRIKPITVSNKKGGKRKTKKNKKIKNKVKKQLY